MRVVLLLLLTAILAWGVVQILGDGDKGGSRLPAPDPREALPDDEGAGQPVPTTGVLVITVTSRSAHIPHRAEGGYRMGGIERWRAVDERGQAVFLDAPLGNLQVLGRAPGFHDGQQKRYLAGGLRTDVILVLERDGSPPQARDR